jgi:F420-non-reducing hydrogenase iron-sulfur subunit
MCSGRVDPALVLKAFLSGADGVMVGACLKGECHYSVGNLIAEGKMRVLWKVLHRIGLDPERLAFRMMSSAQGARFVEYATDFQTTIAGLGPLGSSEGVEGEELRLKLEAARSALLDKKLRWIEGKWVEFREEGNLYCERFTLHELGRMCEEIVMDECAIQEIRLRLTASPMTVRELSKAMSIPAYRILRHLADMQRNGLVEMDVRESGDPAWIGLSPG